MGKSRSIVGGLTTLAVLGGIAVLLWYFLGRPQTVEEFTEASRKVGNQIGDKIDDLNISWPDLDDFTNVLDNLDGLDFGSLYDRDPYVGDNRTNVWSREKYNPSNGGLSLTLLNALDEEWQKEFENAVSDWQESDALTLRTGRVEVDHTCTPVDGVMVVCNANFGKTGWVGICENQMMGGKILASVAKMNEYYLHNADFDHRRYTMCHEIGHGFGLPHTDEIFSNRPQGNCLDYTDDPSANLLPGDVNFAKLRNMYLYESKRRLGDNGRVIETRKLIPKWAN